MREFIQRATVAAKKAISLIGQPIEVIEQNLVAGPKQCQWCPLKGVCETLDAYVHETVFDQFADLTQPGADMKPKDTAGMDGPTLAGALERLDLILLWASEVRAEGLRRVKNGIPVPRWKQVAGKKGKREWSDKDGAEAVMKAARLKTDDMFSKSLITAPAADKLMKKLKKPKIWTKLQALVTQKDGQPGLAPESDSRPALISAAQFDDISGAPEAVEVPAEFADLI